uniref:DYW domain-containing protein n=1 Tax=Kalanchoe fedtschenkoi TaxID=63787 RepID=A0A7N0T3L6_KALFE
MLGNWLRKQRERNIHLRGQHHRRLSLLVCAVAQETAPAAEAPLISVARLEQCRSVNQVNAFYLQVIVQRLSHLATHVIRTYISCAAPARAQLVLERLSPAPEDVYWWNQLIRESASNESFNDVLRQFRKLLRLGWKPDHYTFPFVLKACGELRTLRGGAAVHAVAGLIGLECNVFVCNAVVAMYGRCGAVEDARKMFDEMRDRGVCDVISWNSIVAGYVQSGDVKRGLRMFDKMVESGCGFRPDAVSLVNVLPACGAAGELTRGRKVHGYAVKSCLCEDVFVGNALVDMYAKCEKMDEAMRVFEGMETRDVVSWNAMVTGFAQIGRYEDALDLFERMRESEIELNVVTWSAVIAGYAQRGLGHESLDVFREMMVSGSKPNIVTVSSLLSGCASAGALLNGKETHCYAIKCILNHEDSTAGDDLMVYNSLIDMYGKCQCVGVARMMFAAIPQGDRNVVTWTVMIGAYAQHGEANEALSLFAQMFKQEYFIPPNLFTISCALMACARLAALRVGKQIHAYVLRSSREPCMLFVSNCLIDMYSKAGDVEAAAAVFEHMRQRNAASWTSLMTGYGIHGRGEETLRVFHEMRRAGWVADGVTFVVLLYACSHSGMADEGVQLFRKMKREFGVVPGVEHYVCMVDLLGRNGRLNEAVKVIKDMPMEATPIIWYAMLSACRLQANVELGEYAAKHLMELESGNDGWLTLLSNIYANARRWKDVARVRSLMKHSGIKKKPGCSWVQGKKGTASFFVGDRSHPMSSQIYNLLSDLVQRIKQLGYVPETAFALHDVDDEEKNDLLFEHSEKLALAYGILTTPAGMPIRITKNIRVCGDCHTAMTYISRIIDHDIILRDSSRFHHFKNGSCSCRCHW